MGSLALCALIRALRIKTPLQAKSSPGMHERMATSAVMHGTDDDCSLFVFVLS